MTTTPVEARNGNPLNSGLSHRELNILFYKSLLATVNSTNDGITFFTGYMDLVTYDDSTNRLRVRATNSKRVKTGSRRVVDSDQTIFNFNDCCLGHVDIGFRLF